jgi:hypothetical protein
MTTRPLSRYAPTLACCAVVLVLLIMYLWTMQTTPNRSDHPLMIDVGEMQIVLNVWGTLHATGYPHYVITGNILTTLLKALGFSAAFAPSIVSLIWGIVALAFTYTLMVRLSRHAVISALILICFGLTRMVWLHNSIAEIYTFGLALLAIMLYLALGMSGRDTARLYALALLGGVAVAHHRALALAIPALVYAMWLPLTGDRRLIPRHIVVCLALGLLGFLPYAYLPARDMAGAAWVYGEPNTVQGFLDQFLGREASRFIGSVDSLDALITNFQRVNTAVLSDVTIVGLIAGVVGLALGIRARSTRRAAISLSLLAISAYAFHVLVYTDILVMLILMITLPLAFGWLFVGMALISRKTLTVSENSPHPLTPSPSGRGGIRGALVIVGFAIFAVWLGQANSREITVITAGTSDMRPLLERAPQNATAMIAWGTRYFEASFEHGINGVRPDLRLVDHKADYRAILESGAQLITPDFTFYSQPASWWEERIGAPVYLTSAAPNWINIALEPSLYEGEIEQEALIDPIQSQIRCDSYMAVYFSVDWVAPRSLEKDYSVFVHVYDTADTLMGQGDQFAPVYGLRPTTTWEPREIMSDYYSVYLLHGDRPTTIRYGFYEQLPDGSFNNVAEYELPVNCP